MFVRILVLAAVLIGFTSSAFAQGSFFTSLSGTVVDSSGGVIPGANVKVKNNGTGQDYDVVSGGDGGFTIPSLPGGTYSVTVSLMGFKTAQINAVTLNAAVPASVKVTLSVGTLEENVTVVGESATIVQTQSPSISNNLTSQAITSLPLTSRNALDALTGLAGFSTSGTARNSSVNGIPRSAINITLDGMNIQDNYLKTTDGYFARLTPTLDSVEEVTVTTAGNTTDATGQGSVQVKFVTKSGSNNWTGTAYEYLRRDTFNANTWFNNRDLPPDPATGKAPRPLLRSYQLGIAQGGPIIPNKAFFFVNYEEQRAPSSSTLQRIALTQDAANGIFSYNVAGGTRSVNLLQLAAANGQLATLDPTVAKVQADIRAAMATTGTIAPLSNPLVNRYTFQTPTASFNPSPTFRVDYELTQRHRLTGSMNYRHINSTPDTTNNAQVPFPGMPMTGSQQSTRWTTSESVRSTFGNNLVNEARFGGTGGSTLFSPELEPSMFAGTGNARLNFNAACCGAGFTLTNLASGAATTGNNIGLGTAANSAREASTWVFEDTATWLKGKHTFNFGGSLVQADVWLENQTQVPTVGFGLISSEPADAIFNNTTLQSASTADITQAKNLYAMVTGRINSITADARINPDGSAYVPLGKSRAAGRMREFDLFLADSWRTTPTLTVSAGLRYVLANPFYPVNNSYSTTSEAALYGISGAGNIFKPGTLSGSRPLLTQYAAGTYAYNPDRNNFAPSIGFAWQPPSQSGGFKELIFGSEEGDSVIRGGFAMAFQRPGMSDFTGVFGANQGLSTTLNRDQTTNNLGTLPRLLRDPGALTLPATPSVSYPAVPAVTSSLNVFDSNLQMPYTQSYTVGWQRKLTNDTAFEVRYVGSRHRQDWETRNINEISITDNGFVQEFRKAQANLQANIAAGRGATFAYTGAAGTQPLPTFLAFFQGLPSGQAANAAVYTSTQFTNATNLGFLAAQSPNPFGFASTNSTSGFVGNAGFRANGIAAGLPANFFLANPDVLGGIGNASSGANLTTNFGGTRANSIQVEFRKRLSKGLQFNTSYAWADAYMQQEYGLTRSAEIAQSGQVGNVQHAVKGQWLYELPFGEGQRWASHGGGLLNALVGGWEFNGVGRIQTGEQLDFGNVRVVGMSVDEFTQSIDLRVGANGELFILPDDIIQNTVKAFQTSATTANGYSALGAPTGRYLAPANGPDCIETVPGAGDCGVRTLVANAPRLVRFDLVLAKRVKIHGSVNFEFRAEMLNAFNAPYFNIASTGGLPLGLTQSSYGPAGPYANFNNYSYPQNNPVAGASADSFRLVGLLGDNTARIVQLVWRVRW